MSTGRNFTHLPAKQLGMRSDRESTDPQYKVFSEQGRARPVLKPFTKVGAFYPSTALPGPGPW